MANIFREDRRDRRKRGGERHRCGGREFAGIRPDLVLLDITMPGLDGIDTLGRIMEKDKQAKVVIVSSVGNKEMVWKAMKLGARSFLTNPTTRITLP